MIESCNLLAFLWEHHETVLQPCALHGNTFHLIVPLVYGSTVRQIKVVKKFGFLRGRWDNIQRGQ